MDATTPVPTIPAPRIPLAKWGEVFSGVDNFDQSIPADARGTINERLSRSANPQRDKARLANIAYMADRYAKPPSEIAKFYKQYGRHLAKSDLNFDGDLDDKALYSRIGSVVKNRMGEQDMLAPVMEAVGMAAFEGQEDWLPTYTQAMDGVRQTSTNYLSQRSDSYRRAAQATWDQLKPVADQARPAYEAVSQYFKTLSTPKEPTTGSALAITGLTSDDNPQLREAAIAALSPLTPHQRQLVIGFASASAKPAKPKETGAKEGIAQSFERGISSYGKDVVGFGKSYVEKLRAHPTSEGSKMGDIRDQRQIERQLDSAYYGTVSPLKSGNMLMDGVYSATGSLPYMAGAFSMAGIGLNIAAYNEQLRGEFEDAGVPTSQAEGLAAVAAVPYAAVDFVQAKMAFAGKLPGFEKFLNQPVTSLARFVGKGAMTGGLELTEQFAQEITQDAIRPTVQSIASVLSDSIPGVDWSEELSDLAQGSPETLAALLPLALIGTGTATFRDAAYGRQYLNQLTALKQAGFTDALAKEIVEAPTYEAKAALVEANWDKRVDTANRTEEIKAEVATGQEMAPTVEKQGDGTFVVKDETGAVMDTAATPEAAVELVKKAEEGDAKTVDAEETISIKNASIEEELKSMDIPMPERGERITFERARNQAEAEMKADPFSGQNLLMDLQKKPRPPTAMEDALLTYEINRLRLDRDAAEVALVEAGKASDQAAIDAANKRVRQTRDAFSAAADVATKVGTASGQSLAFRRLALKEDYSLARMEQRRVVANEGKPLTTEQAAEVKQLSEQIQKLQAEFDALKASKSIPGSPRTVRRPSSAVSRFISTQAEAARKRVAERMKEGRAMSGIDPADFADHVIIGADYIARGITKFADWSVEMVKELGERITPNLQAIYDESVTQVETTKTTLALERKKARLEATIKKLEQKVSTKDVSAEPTTSSRPSVQEVEVLEQRRDELRDELDAIREEARKIDDLEQAISDKEKKIKAGELSTKPQVASRPSPQGIEVLKQERDALNKELAKARKEARKPSEEQRIEKEVNAIRKKISEKREMIRTGDVSLASQAANRPEVREIEEARQELEEVNDQLAEMRKPVPKTAEQKRLARVEAEIAKIEEQIESGEIFPKGKRPSLSSPEIAKAEDQLTNLKEQRQYLRETIQPRALPMTAEEKRLAAYKSRSSSAITELRRRITEGDFSKKERKPLSLDPEAMRLKAELDLAKRDYERLLERDRYENLSLPRKAGENLANSYDMARLLMTTGELSFILRQGKFAVASNPILAARALPNAIKALFGSEAKAHALNLQILDHPDYELAKAAKLHLVDENASLNKQEESLMGRWAGKIPVVKNFNQAANVFLNKLRFDVFQVMRQGSGGLNSDEQKQIANYVNVATGRGSLGKAEGASVVAGRLMFAPRYVASRIQYAVGQPLWGGNARTRKLIAAQYAKTLISMGLYYSSLLWLFSGGDDEPEVEMKDGFPKIKLDNDVTLDFDPRGSDFGKVKIGNTRLDVLAGVAQVIVFGARTSMGETKSGTGRVRDIRGADLPYGSEDWADVAVRFGRSKLHPVLGSSVNVLAGTNLVGEESTAASEAANLVRPLTYSDIAEALREQEIDDAVILGLLAMLGEGVQTYDQKKPAKPASK